MFVCKKRCRCGPSSLQTESFRNKIIAPYHPLCKSLAHPDVSDHFERKIVLTNMIVDFYERECDLYVLLALEVDVRPPRGPIHCKRYKWPADWQARVPTQATSHIFIEPLKVRTLKKIIPESWHTQPAKHSFHTFPLSYCVEIILLSKDDSRSNLTFNLDEKQTR